MTSTEACLYIILTSLSPHHLGGKGPARSERSRADQSCESRRCLQGGRATERWSGCELPGLFRVWWGWERHFTICHSEPCAIVMLLSCHRHVHFCMFLHILACAAAQLVQDKEGNTPLSFAVRNGHAAAQFLLDHNAYVDARNTWGETPLFVARSWKLQDLLLEHGANRIAKNFANESAKRL